MKCPNCGNDMVQSRAGWLCVSCGHIERATSDPTAEVKTGQDGHDQMRAAAQEYAQANPVADSSSSSVPQSIDSSDSGVVPTVPADDGQAGDDSDSSTPTTSSVDSDTDSAAPEEDSDTQEEPPPAVSAAPWEAPSSTPSESDDPAKATEDASVPSPADLSAVEAAVANATQALDGEKGAASEADKPDADAGNELPGPLSPDEDDDGHEDPKEAKSESHDGSSDDTPAAPSSDANATGDDKPEPEKTPDHAGSLPSDETKTEAKADDPDKVTSHGKPEPGKEDASPTTSPAPIHAASLHKPRHKKSPKVEAPEADAAPEAKGSDAKSADESAEDDKHDNNDAKNLDTPPTAEPTAAAPQTEPGTSYEESAEPAETLEQAEKEIARQDELHDSPDVSAPSSEPKPVESNSATSQDASISSPVVPTPQASTEHSADSATPGQQDSTAEHTPLSTPPAIVANDAPVPAAPTVATTSANPSPAKPLASIAPTTHPAPWSLKKTVALVIAIVAILAIVVIGLILAWGPNMALGSYIERLDSSHPGTVHATISYASNDYRLAMTGYGTSSFASSENPTVDLNITGQLSGTKKDGGGQVAGPVAGEIRLVNQILYFKLNDSTIVNEISGSNLGRGWYQVKLGSNSATCTASSADPLLGGGLTGHMPVVNTSFAGFATINGAEMLHYKGSLDASKITPALNTANANVPAACRISVPSSYYQNMAIRYDLYRGWSSDRLVAYLSSPKQGTLQLTMDTASTSRQASVTAPNGAQNGSSIFTGGVLGASTVNPLADNAAIKADLAAYAHAYQATAVGWYFPTVPAAIKLSLRSPSTGKPFVITTAPVTAAGQIQYAAGHACSGYVITPGRELTHYVALYTLLNGSKAPYCLNL